MFAVVIEIKVLWSSMRGWYVLGLDGQPFLDDTERLRILHLFTLLEETDEMEENGFRRALQRKDLGQWKQEHRSPEKCSGCAEVENGNGEPEVSRCMKKRREEVRGYL